MTDGLFSWHPAHHTADENSRWVWLRSEEWDSYPNFLSPVWGIVVVYHYGWIIFLLALIVITFLWKLLIMNSFLSIRLLYFMPVIVNTLKWPFAVLLAIISYKTQHYLLFSASLLLFPVISYICAFLELPYNLGGILRQGKNKQDLQNRIFHKLGMPGIVADPTAEKGKHPFLF